MEKNDRRTIGRTRLGVSDIEQVGVDLFQRGERCVRPGLIVGNCLGLVPLVCASAEPLIPNRAAATVMAAVPMKRRRCWSISSAVLIACMGKPS
jgi:hypothetical protein